MFCLLLTGCASVGNTFDVNSVDASEDSTRDTIERIGSIVSSVIDIENDCSYTEFKLSDELAIKIATDCFLTFSVNFKENDEIRYSDIFPYFMYDGCYTYDRKGILTDIVQYYDVNSGKFSIPYKIADNFLKERFNTIPDRFSVKCYNQQTECYEFNRHDGELYYDIVLCEKEKVDYYTNRYMFTVMIGHYLTDTIPVQYHTYIVEFNENDYKILSKIAK